MSLTSIPSLIFNYAIIIYIMVSLSAYFLFYFAMNYCLNKNYSKLLTVTAIIPILTIIIVATSHFHNWFMSMNQSIIFITPLEKIIKYGFWFYVHATYSYILILISCVLFIKKSLEPHVKNKTAVIGLTISTFLFTVGNFIGVLVGQEIYLTTILPFVAINAFYFTTFFDEDTATLFFSKKNFFHTISFPVLIFNAYDELLECNQIAMRYFEQFNITIEKYKKYSAIFAQNQFEKISTEYPLGNSSILYFKNKSLNSFLYAQCTDIITETTKKYVGQIISLYSIDIISPLMRKLEENVYSDPLCGCFNRAYFDIQKNKLLINQNLPLVLLIADIDNLKIVNDELGHAVGDDYIKTVANILKKVVRADDNIFRIGGDEFVIFLPNLNTYSAERILKNIAEESLQYDKPYTVSISVGFSIIKEQNEKFEEHFQIADKKMYTQKKTKKSSYPPPPRKKYLVPSKIRK